MGLAPARPAASAQIWYVTVRFPTGRGEEFLGPEIAALQRLGEVTVVPLRPPRDATAGPGVLLARLLAPRVLVNGAAFAIRHPILTLTLVAALLRGSPANIARNLLVIPKALWIACSIPHGAHLHAAWATTPATACYLAARVTGNPWSFSAHRHDIEAENLLARKACHASFVRCISESGRDAVRRGIGSVRARVEVVHLGVSLPPSISPRDNSGPVTVLAAASLIPLKNHVTMLAALALPEAAHIHLLLAGDGPERPRLVRRAASLGVSERVRFLGQVPHDELLALYDSGTVRVATLASEIEGIPVSLMEALSHGIPVVAPAIGGLSELVSPGVGRLIDDPLDAAALAQAWDEVAGWDPAVVAPKARQVIADGFNVDRLAERLVELMHPVPG